MRRAPPPSVHRQDYQLDAGRGSARAQRARRLRDSRASAASPSDCKTAAADSRQADLLPDEFVDRFAIAGPPDYCIERLHELAELGLEKVIVSGPTAGADPVEARRAAALLDEAVVPAFASSPAMPAPSVDDG